MVILFIIIHQTNYEKSDWSRAFNQFTIACELDMINAISASDIALIMSSSTSAWLLSPLEYSSQRQNGWKLRFCFWGWITCMWKMYNKTIIEFGFRMISWIIKTSCLCYLPKPKADADNTDLSFDNSWYHAQPHPVIILLFNGCLGMALFRLGKSLQLCDYFLLNCWLWFVMLANFWFIVKDALF